MMIKIKIKAINNKIKRNKLKRQQNRQIKRKVNKNQTNLNKEWKINENLKNFKNISNNKINKREK